MRVDSYTEGPSRIPSGITVAGDLTSDNDLSIEGTFEGQITLPEQHLAIGRSARVRARILARSVSIAGQLDGNVTATQRVRIDESADVHGHIQTPSLELTEGARFTGTVDPNRSEAAMLVARYRQKQG
jgi:cytoskeletal protein CcmA (bactofilin family)